MSNNLICFGDVVKLAAKSAFVESDADAPFLGFLEHKKDLLLVVAPVKHATFVEAEFLVAPVRGDKPPLPGSPLTYKQPFVLKTSDGSGYALNNKTPNSSEVVSLRESSALGIKGEMYVAVEKAGFGPETHVHDGDTSVELHVVDSNRIRKKYNNVPLRHFQKLKTDAPGGHVTCSTKGHVLSFKIVKLADKTETRTFIADPVFRRASQMLLDAAKADETSEASVIDSPSRAGSIVTVGPLVADTPVVVEETVDGGDEDVKVETPETTEAAAMHEPEVARVVAMEEVAVDGMETDVVASATITTTTTTTTVENTTTTHAMTSGVDAAALAAQLQHVAVAEHTKTAHDDKHGKADPHPTKHAESPVHETLATIELSVASISETDALDGSVPVHDKLSHTHMHAPATRATFATDHSELDTLSGLPTVHEEHLETACAGKCAIM